MQCPNCYTEASPGLSRCPRCDAPLYQRPPAESPGYSTPHEARRDGGYHGDQDAGLGNGGNGGNAGGGRSAGGGYSSGGGYSPAGGSSAGGGYSGYSAGGGYGAGGLGGGGGPEDQWEPSSQWAPDWRPDDEPERPGAHRSESWRDASPPRKQGHPFLIAMIAGIVIGGMVAAVILLWPSGDETGTTPNSSAAASAGASGDDSSGSAAGAHDQAVAINGLLDEMAASRSALGPAITEAARCDGIDAAIPELDRVKEERQDQLDKAKNLKVDALTDGTALRESLVRAAGHSLDADEAFLAWAKANEGCLDDETPRDDNFKDGQRLSSDRASPEKEDFVELWNPIAEEQGLPARSAEKF